MKNDFKPVKNNQECEQIVQGTYHGTLAMCNDREPYAIPMNHAFIDGKFYFHCATTGHKLDMIKHNPNVVYVIQKYYGSEEDFKKSMECHGRWESIVAYGKATIIDGKEELRAAFIRYMSYHGKVDFEPSESAYSKTRFILFDVEKMTARREFPDKSTEYWIWDK